MSLLEKITELLYENNVRCDQGIEGLADYIVDILNNDNND